MDVLIAVPCLLLLLAPMLLIAAAIRITSGPPVLFTQERVGRFGRRFRIVKFRSMTQGAEAGGSVTIAEDPRTTTIGRVLRKWKLDELPQLWNVVRGDMSLVGPRADVPGVMDRLRGADRVILSVRPGITGPATLAYRNEEALLGCQRDPEAYNSEVLFPNKVRINKPYVEELSLRKDVYYLFKTVVSVLRNEQEGSALENGGRRRAERTMSG
jgi:lipopolysaccharide/colanic/teichoic acid biosynthesis glycosyltransferase